MNLRRAALAPIVAGAVLLAVASRPAAADDVVEMSFEGFGPAGVHLMTTHTVIEETPAWYSIQGDVATAGLGALFVNLANRSVTQGREIAETPQPVSFQSETSRNGAVQRNQVDYPPNGMPSGSSTPPPAEPVTPIDAHQLAGTVDNLTAYWLLERQLAHGGGCALKVPVFDGRHRYDLEFGDAGRATLAPSDGQNFTGATQVCAMARHEIGGFYVDKKHAEGASSGVIWYAPLLSDLAVPVRLKMDTEIGGVSIYLSQLRGRGVNLRLME